MSLLDKGEWIKGVAHWREDAAAFISVAFTWRAGWTYEFANETFRIKTKERMRRCWIILLALFVIAMATLAYIDYFVPGPTCCAGI